MRRFFRYGALLMAVIVSINIFVGNEEHLHNVASAQIAPNEKWILVQVHEKRLTLYKGTQKLKQYPIATGASSTPTPLGTFKITSRFKSEMSGFGTRFLRLNVPWGEYGIHGTNKPYSIGQNASHGCIRMYVEDAEELYSAVKNGTTVVIEGGPYGLMDTGHKELVSGDRNSHVYAVQERLKMNGFYMGNPDGIYGNATANAVLKARAHYGLSRKDKVDWALYQKLGLILFE